MQQLSSRQLFSSGCDGMFKLLYWFLSTIIGSKFLRKLQCRLLLRGLGHCVHEL